MSKLPGPELPDLGAFLREQRENAQLSLRQLAALAGVSNPYLSQIERGLKKPSAEILQQLARGLELSAETLYVRAGILDERPVPAPESVTVLQAIARDPALTERQRAVLVDVYRSFTGTAASRDAGAGAKSDLAAEATKAATGSAGRTQPSTETSTKGSSTTATKTSNQDLEQGAVR